MKSENHGLILRNWVSFNDVLLLAVCLAIMSGMLFWMATGVTKQEWRTAIFGRQETVIREPKRGLRLDCSYCKCRCMDRNGDGVMECDRCWCTGCPNGREIPPTFTPWPTWTQSVPPFPTTTFEPYPLPTWPVITPYP